MSHVYDAAGQEPDVQRGYWDFLREITRVIDKCAHIGWCPVQIDVFICIGLVPDEILVVDQLTQASRYVAIDERECIIAVKCGVSMAFAFPESDINK